MALRFLNSGYFAGKVGIGIEVPVAKLQVAGTTTYNSDTVQALRVCDATDTSKGIHIGFDNTLGKGIIQAGDFGVQYKDLLLNPNTGNIGIGTTSPDAKLDIESATNPTIRLTNSTNALGAASVGTLEFFTKDSSTGASRVLSSIVCINEADSPSVPDGQLVFKTSLGGANAQPATEKMRIDPSGNVGIGSASPSAKLDVEAGATGASIGDTSTAAIFRAGRQNVFFQDIRTAAGSDWNNATFKIIAKIDSTSHQSIDFVNDLYFQEHIDILTGNQVFNTRFDANGKVGIGDSTPSYKLDVNGTIRATGDVIAYSDARVKENVVTIDNALDKVNKLRGVTYTRNDIEDKQTKMGVIAQEVLEVIPEVVQQDNEGNYSVAYGNMNGLLIEAIKELKAEIEELKSRL